MTLRPYQIELRDKIYAAWQEPNVRNVVAVAPTGAGKCLGRDTPVLMYDGCVMPVQNILPGMSVMGPDSQPRLVTSICRGVGQLYRVVPKKGDPYVVNDAHILSLKRTREKTGGSKNLVVNLNVEEFARSNKWTRHLLKGWRTSVTFNNDAMLPIDPYFLGVWLAEGSIGGQAITTPEPEIKQYLFSFAAAYNYGINIIPGKNCETINIHNYRNRKYGPLHILRALTVINEKHIPHLYKTASRQDRLILLAGYLDGDGYLCKNYYDAICNTERLANDIAFLARSLGFACYIRKCVKGIKSYGFSADYWRLSISGDISQIPCRVERRKAKERRQKKDVLVTSINIEPIGIGEYFGFELAGKDGLFLLGDFTVTHNTKIKASIFAGYRQPAVAIAHRQELVGQISLALAQEGVIHRIVAPDIVRAFCVSKHVEALGKSFHHASSPVAVAGIDTLNARHEKLIQWINTVRLWDIDECFPAGTRITTPCGYIPIEMVRLGDVVTSFNEQTGRFESRRVVRTFRNLQPHIMFDILINGRHVRATPGHPFWTRRGWVEAKDLKANDDLFIYVQSVQDIVPEQQGTSKLPIQENRERILQQDMRYDLSGCTTQTSCKKSATNQNLHSVLFASQTIRQDMRSDVCGDYIVSYDDTHESEICFATNDRAQSDVSRRRATENDENIAGDWSSANYEGRKRSRTIASGTTSCRITDAVRVYSAITNQNEYAARFGLSELLQTGHSTSVMEDSNRSRWNITCGSKTTRPEERGFSYWSRVEGISIYEPRNSGFVYNFEVEGTHTYIADDVIVHNCHHVLAENKWGKGVKLFTNAYGVGFTATPGRPDRRGLGRHASGVFDRMVIGPTMRPLIDAGFLADYRIFVPPASYTMTEEDVSDTTGDYKPERLRAKSHSSTITGDIVSHYLRIAPGKRGITFTVDVETAAEVAQAFNNAGVPAASVSAKTPDAIRDKLISKFRRGDLKQLVNVDIFGEGFDVPAVEVVSDGRSTKSFPRYAQAFGRALRPADGKTHGVYIDHVSNVKVHGVPDRPRVWTLDDERGKRRAADASDSVRVCDSCFNAYEPFRTCCPFCGHKPTPANRSTPQFVDGDLIELDPVVLMQMRGEIERIDANGPVIPLNLVGTPAEIRLRRLWNERQAAQVVLRDAMNHWAGMQQTLHGLSDSELYRKFYHEFGTDVLTAQTFGRYDTERLLEKIRESWI